jgi:hypothetical protein
MNRLGYLALLLGCSVLLGAAVGPGYAAIGAQDVTTDRTFSTSEAAPGETVTVTATVQLGSEAEVSLADEFDPEFGSAELVSVQVDGENVSTLIESTASDGVVAVLDPVGPGEVSFTYEVTVPDDAQAGTTYTFGGLFEVGDSEHEIEGDSELTVAAGQSPEFAVTASAMDGTVTAGEDATVEYTVENTGNAEGTQTLSFTVDGTEENTEEVTLGSGETTSGSFSYTTTADDPPDVELGVTSEDDTATVTVTVESDGSDDGSDGGSDDGSDGDSDDGSDDGSDGGSDDGSSDGGSDDGFGPGFGPVVVLGAAALLTAYSLVRLRTEY